jgi:hypothetical protein
MSGTRLFNIRITNEKHARFKEYAEKKNVTMAFLLSTYIDALLADEIDPVGAEGDKPQKKQRAEWVDPLDAIRGQYQAGEDF